MAFHLGQVPYTKKHKRKQKLNIESYESDWSVHFYFTVSVLPWKYNSLWDTSLEVMKFSHKVQRSIHPVTNGPQKSGHLKGFFK